MRTEPALDRDALAAFVAERYGVEVGSLEFLPIGIDSWAYTVRDRGGEPSLFLKLFATRTSHVGLPRGAELPLMSALADLGRVRVPRPVASVDGGLVGRFDHYDLCAWAYIDGRALEDERAWPEGLYGQVAETLGALHASTRAVRDLVPRKESFELPFVRSLLENVARAEKVKATRWSRASPELRQLADVIAPRAADIRRAIGTLGKLRMVAASRRGEAVVTHTDFWGSNLLLTADAKLVVVDWDGAMLAMPEADLFMFAGTSFFPAARFEWFLERYERAFQPIRPAAETLAFYLYRRNLEDIASFLADLVEENADTMPASESLSIIQSLVGETTQLDRKTRALRQLLS